MKALYISTLALCLTACATPYQDMGLAGGVAANRITADTAQITARGNAYTDPDAIQRYALRKAAETTIAAGYHYFEILSDANRSMRGASGSVYGGGGWGGFSSWEMLKPGQSFMIKMRRGSLPTDAPANVFDAQEITKFLGSSEKSDSRECKEVEGKVQCTEPSR